MYLGDSSYERRSDFVAGRVVFIVPAMSDATVTTAGGVLLWYAIKYFLLGEYAVFAGMQTLVRHVEVLMVPVWCTTYSIVLMLWAASDTMCSDSLRTLSMTLVITNCIAFAMHVVAIQFPAASSWVFVDARIGAGINVSPVNAAVFVVLLHTAIAGAREFPDTICSSIFTITPVWVATACMPMIMQR